MANNAMELGIENIKVNNSPSGQMQQPMYRPLKKKLPRTYINILHDPRVVRGNTYAAFVIPSSLQKEFMYLKEQEERRKRLLKHPKKLPRVAFLAQKMKEDNDENKEQLEKRPESPKLQELEDPEFIEDYPYFYIDKPPTPKYIPQPPGREIASQVEDGELFDYDLEVKPILEVLVGRSLIQARMELIEEHERTEYLKHKKKYEQIREFELINLQRQEAARIRREEEKKRRENQKKERTKMTITTQKKLIANTFSKRLIFPLKNQCFNHLLESGVLRNPKEFSYVKLVDRSLINVTEEINDKNTEIEKVVKEELMIDVKQMISKGHRKVVQEHNNKLEQEKADKEKQEKNRIEEENKRKIDKENEREKRRNDRIKKKIEETNIASKAVKQDMLMINLADIDEFSIKTEHVHTFGGYYGEILIILNEMYEKYFSQLSEQEIINAFNSLLARLLTSLDKRVLEIKYFETIKIDMNVPIDKADAAAVDNYKGIYYDYRRIASKSIKFLLENHLISEKTYNLFLDAAINLLLQKPIDPEIVEKDRDPNNTEPEYLEKLNKEKEEIKQKNEALLKLKDRVKFTYAKVEDYKKKRNKMAAIVDVTASDIMEIYKEEDPEAKTENTGQQNNEPAQHKVDKVDVSDENSIKYVNNVSVFQNTIIPYDFYIIHDGATDLIRLKILSEFKNIIGKDNFDLQTNFNIIQKKFKKVKESIVENIKMNEKFFEKEIKGYKPLFSFNVSSVENKT